MKYYKKNKINKPPIRNKVGMLYNDLPLCTQLSEHDAQRILSKCYNECLYEITKDEFDAYQKYVNLKDKISENKLKLFDTDYQAIKFAEGQLTEEEYANSRNQRQIWRDEINELEKDIMGILSQYSDFEE